MGGRPARHWSAHPPVYESPGLRLALHYGDGGAAAAGVAAAGPGVRARLRPPTEGKSSGSGSGECERSTGNIVFRSLCCFGSVDLLSKFHFDR